MSEPGWRSDSPGAESGLQRIYRECRLDLRRFLVARTGSPEDADDVLQDLWVRLSGVSPGPVANGRAYLFRMAQNLVLDRLKLRRRSGARDHHWLRSEFGDGAVASEPVDQSRSVEQALIDREDVDRLAFAVAALPRGAARAFRLHKLDGLSHGEVAARLGISKSGVEKHMAVAMAHLRRSLTDD